jgi:hypothetical protein
MSLTVKLGLAERRRRLSGCRRSRTTRFAEARALPAVAFFVFLAFGAAFLVVLLFFFAAMVDLPVF